MTEAIKLTIPDSLAKDSKENVEAFGYYNLQEMVLEGLRNLNKELNRQKALEWLQKSKGKRKLDFLTKEERIELAKSLNKEQSEKIFRKYDFNKII